MKSSLIHLRLSRIKRGKETFEFVGLTQHIRRVRQSRDLMCSCINLITLSVFSDDFPGHTNSLPTNALGCVSCRAHAPGGGDVRQSRRHAYFHSRTDQYQNVFPRSSLTNCSCPRAQAASGKLWRPRLRYHVQADKFTQDNIGKYYTKLKGHC